MSSMAVRATLTIFLLFIATVNADKGGVSFWLTTVTMTSPDAGDWYYKNAKVQNNTETYEFTYENSKKGTYYCTDGNKKYYFYVQGKVCDNCFELDPLLFGSVLIFDLVGTTVLMMTIYRCTKKKSSATVNRTTSRAPILPGGATSSTPSPYEALNPHTRSQEPYSTVNRMG